MPNGNIRIEDVDVDYPMSAEVLFIDDGSTLPMPETFARRRFMALHAVDILQLRRNLGHQRAIAFWRSGDAWARRTPPSERGPIPGRPAGAEASMRENRADRT